MAQALAVTNLRRRLARSWLAALPCNARERIVRDFVDWSYADLAPSLRADKVSRYGALLLEWIPETHSGFWIVLYSHLRRLPIARPFALGARGLEQQQDPRKGIRGERL